MPDATDELLAAARHYLDTFFIQRDAAAAAALASDNITGFGTGTDEKVYTIDFAIHLYERDIEQMPDPVNFELHAMKAQPLSDTTGLVMGEMDWHMKLLDQTVIMHGVRFTLVMTHFPEGWRVEHKHLSQPSSAHGEDEAYPLKEMENRTKVLRRMVEKRTRELEQAHEQMRLLAITDPLTRLYNRARTDEVLDLEIARLERHDGELTVVLMDIDHFKPVNDQFGHDRGDRVLVEMAGVLRERARKTDCVGRWGGEEFLLICPDTHPDCGAKLAEQLRREVAEHPFPLPLPLSVSFGVAGYRPGDRRETLIKRADQALYRAKQSGRDRVEVHCQ